MAEFNPIQLNIPDIIRRQALGHAHSATPSFLNLTSQTNTAPLVAFTKKSEDVLSGDVADEIDKITTESDIIQGVIDANSSTEISVNNVGKTLNAGKTISFTDYNPVMNNSTDTVKSSSHVVAKKTNTNKLIGCIQYSSNYEQQLQKEIFLGAVERMANWLDDMIINYDERVAEGKARGDSEVKLSFLLRLRKQIENCDFPVGFGNDEYFQANSGGGVVVLGAYSNSYTLGTYLNPTDNAQDNNAAIKHTGRNIILNAGAFVINRKYKTETELVNAIDRGDFNYLQNLTYGTDAYNIAINDEYGNIIMASKDFYLEFAQTYLASVLAHEFIHATHIADEVVTYNTCELIEDDYRDKVVFDGWSATTQAKIDTVFAGMDLSSITFGESFIPIGGGGGLGFHDLAAYDDTSGKENVVQHGWENNGEYTYYYLDNNGNLAERTYDSYRTGNKLGDVRNDLLNFVV